jgi:hypothetical protein
MAGAISGVTRVGLVPTVGQKVRPIPAKAVAEEGSACNFAAQNDQVPSSFSRRSVAKRDGTLALAIDGRGNPDASGLPIKCAK